jgi:hypothetical protein
VGVKLDVEVMVFMQADDPAELKGRHADPSQ